MPEATSTVQSVELINKLMKVVGETPGVGHYSAISGFNISNGAIKSNSGTIFCQLKPWSLRKEMSERVPGIIDVMIKRIAAAEIKNARVVVVQPAPIPGIGQSAGFSFQIEQRNTTDDVHVFENVVKKFISAANKNPAISRAVSYY